MNEHRTISIADQVFERLEHDILSGIYARGELVSENRLAAELGVSRTPIREAIRRLEQENLLADNVRGLLVVGISRQDMLDMYEIRLTVESEAARRAAENISPEALAEMRDALDMQRFYIEKSDGADYSDKIKDLDSQFHELLYQNCGSNAYRDVLRPMHRKMTKYRKASVRKKSRAEESLREHEGIYQALSDRDSEAAARLTRKHIENARDSIAEIQED